MVTYDYDEISKQGSIFPAADSEDDLIGNYHKIMRYSELITTNSIPRPTFNPNADLTPVNRTLTNRAAVWLAIAERTTTNYVPQGAIPIGEKHLGRRNLCIWADEKSRIIKQYEYILRNYNLQPSIEKLCDILQQFGHIASEGLISIPKFGIEDAVENRRKGLLGTIFAAAWYTKQYPDALIASLDTHEARLWLYDSNGGPNDRADLVGLRFERDAQGSETLHIEVIEVKTREQSADEEHATEQVQRMVSMLQVIFNEKESAQDIFTVSRREVLKYQIITECFRNIHNDMWQKSWSKRLRMAFSEYDKPFAIKISGKIIHIKLNESAPGSGSEEIEPEIRKFILTANDIQKQNFNIKDPVDVGVGNIDFDETLESDINIHSNEVGAFGIEADAEVEIDANDSENIIALGIDRAGESISGVLKIDSTAFTAEIAELSREFKKACEAYRVRIKECKPERAIVGPGVIRFHILLERGQNLDQLKNQLDDIGREMKRSGLTIQTVKNSNEILLDVPRLQRETVLYSDIAEKTLVADLPEQLFFPIGRTPEGNDIIKNLGELPHMLVGGSTGSGKTVFLFCLLASIIRSHPNKNELQLLLSSAGVEDFIHFEGLPHLVGGKIISAAKETVEIIQTVVKEEFEVRAKILSDARVSNIIEYNKKAVTKMAPLVIVIDEFADIADQLGSKQKKDDFYGIVRRIVQIGRKRGVHLVLCTQRPSANLVPTDIKALLNARVALRVNDLNSSRMILEESGAQNLQKHGDLIYKDSDDKLRAQGYLINMAELDDLIEAVKRG